VSFASKNHSLDLLVALLLLLLLLLLLWSRWCSAVINVHVRHNMSGTTRCAKPSVSLKIFILLLLALAAAALHHL
jgi:hypothetical protein